MALIATPILRKPLPGTTNMTTMTTMIDREIADY